MSYFKFGDGPLYMFYTPYHLPHLQLPHSVARAVLFQDPTLTPARRAGLRGGRLRQAGPQGRRDPRRHGRLHLNYGLVDSYENCDDAAITCRCRCPSAARLKRDIPKDQPLRYADVDLPTGRVCDRSARGADGTFRAVGARDAPRRRAERRLGASTRRPSLGGSETHVWAVDADAAESAAAGMRAILARYTGRAPEDAALRAYGTGKPSLATSGDARTAVQSASG